MTTFVSWLDAQITEAHERDRQAATDYLTAPPTEDTTDAYAAFLYAHVRAKVLAEVKQQYIRSGAPLEAATV